MTTTETGTPRFGRLGALDLDRIMSLVRAVEGDLPGDDRSTGTKHKLATETLPAVIREVAEAVAAARREGKVEGLREAVDTVWETVAFDFSSVALGRLKNRITAIEAGEDPS